MVRLCVMIAALNSTEVPMTNEMRVLLEALIAGNTSKIKSLTLQNEDLQSIFVEAKRSEGELR